MINHNNDIIEIRRLNEDIKYEIKKMLNNYNSFLLSGSYNFWLEKDLYNIISTKNCIKVVIIPKGNLSKNINDESIIASLIKNDFAVIINNNNHSKFIVTDKQTYFGSLNMSSSSINYNNEGILLYDNLSNNRLFNNDDLLTKDLIKYTLESLLTYKHNQILGINKSEGYLDELEEKLKDLFNKMDAYINNGTFEENALQFSTELSFIICSYKDKIENCYYNYISKKTEILMKKIEDIKFLNLNLNKESIKKSIEEVLKSVKMENYKLSDGKIENKLIEKNKVLVEKAIKHINNYFKGDKSIEVNLCSMCGKVINCGSICNQCENEEFEDPYNPYCDDHDECEEEVVLRDMLKELQSYLVDEFIYDDRVNNISEYFVPYAYNIYQKEKFNLLRIETKNGTVDIKYDLFFIDEYLPIYIEFNGQEEELYYMQYKKGNMKFDSNGNIHDECEEEKEISTQDVAHYISELI